MAKKRLNMLLATLMLFSVLGLTGCGETIEWGRLQRMECCEEVEMSTNYFSNITHSTEAYNEAKSYFLAVNGNYTDDFGGLFVDGNGIYNICVVGNRKPVKSDYLIYKRVKNPYNFLNDILIEVESKMQEYSIWATSICASCNRAMICLENESCIVLIIEHLKAKNLYKKDSLNFFVGKNNITTI